MRSKAKATVEILAENKTGKALRAMERQFQSTAKKLKSTGKAMTAAITLPAVLFGASSLKEFASFEAAMAKVKAVSGAVGPSFAALEKNAKDLGAATRFSAAEVAGLQLEYSKLGFNPREITGVTKSTLALAQATGEELADAAAVAGASLRSFEISTKSTSRVTDLMAKSFSSSALDLEKWRESMKTAAPLAKAAGVEIEETAALLSVLADSGIAGSLAGTALKAVFNKIKKEGVPLQETLKKLGDENISLADAEKLVGERGQAALLILAKNSDKIGELTEKYEDSAGAASDMAAIMDDTAEGAMKRFASAFSALQIEVGGILAKGLLPLLETLGPILTSFSELDEMTKLVIVSTIGLAAAIGPVLIGLGLLIGIIPTVIKGLKALAVWFRVAWASALGPIAAIALGLTYIGYAIADVTGHADDLTKNFDKLSATEKTLVTIQQAFHFIKIAIAAAGIAVYELVYQFLDLDRQIINALNGGKSNMAKFGNFMAKTGNKIVDGINDAIQSFVSAVVKGAEAAFNGLVEIAEKSVNKVIGAVNTISDWIPGASNIGEISLGKVSFETPQLEGMKGFTTHFDESFKAAGENGAALYMRTLRDESIDGIAQLLDEIPDGSEFLKVGENAGEAGDELTELEKNLKALTEATEGAEGASGKLGKGLAGAGELGKKAAQSIGFAFDAMGKKAVQALTIATLAGTATAEQQAELRAIKTVQAFELGLSKKEASAKAAIDKVFGVQDQFGDFGGFGNDPFGGGDQGFGGGFGSSYDFPAIRIPGNDEIDQLRSFYDEKINLLREKGLEETELAIYYENQKKDALAQIRQQQVAGYGQSFDSIIQLTEAFGGKQKGILKGLFAVSKGFAIAESVIAIQTAISKALAHPAGFPANLGFISQAISQGANIISTIKGTQPSFLGGGYTGSGIRAGGVDGRGGFNAVLHPGETVVDHSQGQGAGGGVTVNMTINGDPNPSVVAQLREEISNFAISKLANIQQRGGSRAQAVSPKR